MHYLRYLLTARTAYGLHSPALFRLYQEVLYARLSPHTAKRLQLRRLPRRCRQYHEVLFKLACRYAPQRVLLRRTDDATCRCLACACPQAAVQEDATLHEDCLLLSATGERIALVCLPHGTPVQRQRWQQLREEGRYPVLLDLYQVGVLLDNPHLSAQYLMLKGVGW